MGSVKTPSAGGGRTPGCCRQHLPDRQDAREHALQGGALQGLAREPVAAGEGRRRKRVREERKEEPGGEEPTDRQEDRRMDRWMDRWMNGWMDR